MGGLATCAFNINADQKEAKMKCWYHYNLIIRSLLSEYQIYTHAVQAVFTPAVFISLKMMWRCEHSNLTVIRIKATAGRGGVDLELYGAMDALYSGIQQGTIEMWGCVKFSMFSYSREHNTIVLN